MAQSGWRVRYRSRNTCRRTGKGPLSTQKLFAIRLDSADRRLLHERRAAIDDSANLLLREVNHRAANNLQIAASLLVIRARRMKSPEARQELLDAANRIRAVGLVHKRLYQLDEIVAVDVWTYLRDLCVEVAASYEGSDLIDLRFQAEHPDAIFLHSDAVGKLGIIVTELITNCAKHAGPGTICRVGLLLRPAQIEVSVSDDGAGLPLEPDANKEPGLGMQIVHSLAAELHGTVVPMPSPTGATFVLTIPLRQP